mmetsp:Transcript_8281/g.17115  ORF Transcript_8281/g.17115 Transcript_8281/m.17115 type:complete len:131 (-) Transcript_8281:260-652(-)
MLTHVGILMLFSSVLSKASERIAFNALLGANLTSSSGADQNAKLRIFVTDFGIITDVIKVSLNALSPIFFNRPPSLNLTSTSPEDWNAKSRIFVTFFGISTDFSSWQKENAYFGICVQDLGMVTTPLSFG